MFVCYGKHTLEQIEMGRETSVALATGVLWQRGFQPSQGPRRDTLRERFTTRLSLHCGEAALAAQVRS